MAETEQSQQEVVEGKGTGDDKDAWNLVILCHLGGLLGLLPALIIWLLKKDDSPLINDQGKEALNFQISVCIYMIASWLLAFVLIGFFLAPAVLIFDLVMIIMATVKASQHEKYRYPLCIRLLK